MDYETVPAANLGAKKFIGLLDEYSRRRNPWRFVSTYGLADISDLSCVKEMFETYGIVVVRRAYTPKETAKLLALGQEFTGLSDRDISRVAARAVKPFAGGSPGVREPRFWPFITHKSVKAIVDAVFSRMLIGRGSITEFGTSMTAHYSARGLHRDFRPWFHPTDGAYNLYSGTTTVLRLLTYPARPGTPGGSFGFIPFSHRKALYEKQAARIGLKRPLEWFAEHREVAVKAIQTGDSAELEEMDSLIMWVHPEPGDILLLDARMLHGGDFILGPRYFFVMSYAREDEKGKAHFHKRWASKMERHEVGYYEHLNKHGLCSRGLLQDCRDAAKRLSAAAA